jgi:hypothetical protein
MGLAEGISHTERLRANLAQLRQALERAQAEGATPEDVAALLKALRRSRCKLRRSNQSAQGLPALRLSAIRTL